MEIHPLNRQQVRNAVERLGGDIPRPPHFWHKFMGMGTREKYGEALEQMLDEHVDDCVHLNYTAPGNFEAPEGAPEGYRWAIEPDPGDLNTHGITSRHVVSTTELIDDFIAALPDPTRPEYFEVARRVASNNPDRWLVGWDFFCLFERAWFLFGMEEILCEMMWRPDRMERLLDALTDYHMRVMDGYADVGAQAYFTSDDLGTQQSLMFSAESFRELFLPRYEKMIDHCHQLGMSFWLHCCGNATAILDDFIAVGLDVIHPIQPIAMDQQATARAYRDRITFLAGIDVQYLLPRGSRSEVEDGTRLLIDTFDQPEGGCLLACSNGIMPETPMENIEAWLNTAEQYGAQHRAEHTTQRETP